MARIHRRAQATVLAVKIREVGAEVNLEGGGNKFCVSRRFAFMKTRLMKRRILIVDDEEGIRLIFLRALQNAGYEVMAVDSASETLRLVHEEAFDLVLLDLSLPDAKELDLLTLLLSARPDLPVMVLTGMPLEQALVDEALARGAREFISKISSLDFILQKVERFFKYGG